MTSANDQHTRELFPSVPSVSGGTAKGWKKWVSGYYTAVYRRAVRQFLLEVYPTLLCQSFNDKVRLAASRTAMVELILREPEPVIEWMLGEKPLRKFEYVKEGKGKVKAEWMDIYFE